MTSGGNNFNDFPENQLPKFRRIGMTPKYRISNLYVGRPYLPYRFSAIDHSASEATDVKMGGKISHF